MTMEMTSDHSPMGGSMAERIEECPGSVAAIRRMRVIDPEWLDKDTAASAEGSTAHEIAAWANNAPRAIDTDVMWRRSPSKFRNYLERYVTDCRALRFSDGVMTWVEHRFKAPEIHEKARGTVDFGALDIPNRRLYVFDLKYGRVPVDIGSPDNPNRQLLYYASNMLLEIEKGMQKHMIDEVVLRIYQPRHPDLKKVVQEVVVDVVTLSNWAVYTLPKLMNRAGRDGAPRKAGAWCANCKALPTCDTAAAHFGSEHRVDGKVEKYPVSLLARHMEQLPRVYAWGRAVRTACERALARKEEIPGYKLVRNAKDPTKGVVVEETDPRPSIFEDPGPTEKRSAYRNPWDETAFPDDIPEGEDWPVEENVAGCTSECPTCTECMGGDCRCKGPECLCEEEDEEDGPE